MFSSFSKFLPTNVNITTPDFLKPAIHNTNQPPEATSTPTDAKHRNVLTKPKAATGGQPDSQISTMDTVSVNDSENANHVDNPGPRSKNESKSRRRKDASTATETFYIVRPPPSKTNHPLNLQVQLLATSGRDRVERRSASSSSTRKDTNGLTRSTTGSRETLNDNPEDGLSLKRTTSIRSNRSDTESVYSAASSVSTNVSTSSSSSGRRMIPLYNLNAHNVMTNSIADAGTDAKIAKFFKRGLEIMGLAVLEPVEVYGKYTWDDGWDSLDPTRNGTAGGGASLSTQVSRTISHLSAISTQRTASPSGSTILTGHNNTNTSHLTPVIEVPSPTTPKAPSPPTEKDLGKKLFGGIFNKKKKETPTPLALLPTSSNDTYDADHAVTPKSSKRQSATPSLSVSSPLPTGLALPDSAWGSSSTTAGDVLLQPQILGLQAVLQSPNIPPKGRPSAYVWVVRRWIRGTDDGFLGLGSMVESLGIMGAEKHGSGMGMEVEVRFEWKRCAKGKTGAPVKDKERHSRRHSIAVEGQSVAAPSSGKLGLLDPSAAADSSPASKRLSFQGFGLGKKTPPLALPNEHLNESNDHLKVSRAPSPNPPASFTTVGTNEESAAPKSPRVTGTLVEESESDSDIEDSERPWNCYLHIRGAPSSRTSSRDELTTPSTPLNEGPKRTSPTRKEKTLDIRLRIAALAPAPHHPKVIAQIKTPYPLPDVLFDANKTGAELKMRSDPDGSRPDLLAESGSSAGGGRSKPVILTSEDIKDVVSCTGLWLVVREGYGGLARKRKGDGWRLRG